MIKLTNEVDDFIDRIKSFTEFPSHFSHLTDNEIAKARNRIIWLRNGQSFEISSDGYINWNHVFEINTATTNLYFYSLHYVGSLVFEYIRSKDTYWLNCSKLIVSSFFDFVTASQNNRLLVETNRGGGSRDHGTAIRVTALSIFLREYSLCNGDIEFCRTVASYIIECSFWFEDDSNYSNNNHGLMVDVALAQVGAILGQATDIGCRFLSKADTRLSDLVINTFDSDGFANENSVGYHRYNLTKYKEATRLFRSWGLKNSYFLKICNKILDGAEIALGFCVWQRGIIPPIGDWPVHPIQDKSIDSSKCFTESGFAVIKSDDLYVSTVCGHRGTAHKHVDDTSITIRYKDVDVVIDSGNYSFDRSSPYRQCLESSYGHSGCFVSEIEGLLTGQYLELKPSGKFLLWDETKLGVSAVIELYIPRTQTKITRSIKVTWPSTIVIEDFVISDDKKFEIDARQGWVIAHALGKKYELGAEQSVHFPGESISATFSFLQFLHGDQLTFNSGVLTPKARGWCSEKDGEVVPTLELSHNKSGKALRFLTTIHLEDRANRAPGSNSSSQLRLSAINELCKRGLTAAGQTQLAVDFYRIRRKLAITLPVKELLRYKFPIRGYPKDKSYPWGIWLCWALEDRIAALAFASEYSADLQYRDALEMDLHALAAWPVYRATDRIDLTYAHAVRALWLAYIRLTGLPDNLRSAIREGLTRAVCDALPLFEQDYGAFKSVEDLLRHGSHEHFHNTHLVGVFSLALAAKAVLHPASLMIDRCIEMLLSGLSELRRQKIVEGPSYDGYVFDFSMDWLGVLPREQAEQFLSQIVDGDLVDEFLLISAPGDVHRLAALGDVEPIDMPFYLSGLAKLFKLWPTPQLVWLFSRCDLKLLRADALFSLSNASEDTSEDSLIIAQAPAIGCLETPTALVLRTGYEVDDVAVVIAACDSPMNHIQFDNGSLVIGTRKRWLIDDPGYQQYMDTAERQFTTGPNAHNSPVINGHGQTIKKHRRLKTTKLVDDLLFAQLDLTACYAPDTGVSALTRSVWLCGKEHVVVCDQIECIMSSNIRYNWHGHPDAAWQVQDGSAYLYAADENNSTGLWISSSHLSIDFENVVRLPGSRGHLTLTADILQQQEKLTKSAIWWVFSLSPEKPSIQFGELKVSVGMYQLRAEG
jgi:hypothetical protein